MEFHKNIAIIVAHPNDETLWCGGTILLHPDSNWFVVCLCRKNDFDRAPKFRKVLRLLNAEGVMGDLDDSPEQIPLDKNTVEDAILNILPRQNFDLIITHSPLGEYTKHLRHEEIGRAVITLWKDKKINTKALWFFAYEDGSKKYYPKAITNASVLQQLPKNIWEEKYRIIVEVYGLDKTGFEAKTTPRNEAFWKFINPNDAQFWLAWEDIIRKQT